MSFHEELAALWATAEQRRASGEACNPHRDGVADVDYLNENEIQRAHALGLRIELARMAA